MKKRILPLLIIVFSLLSNAQERIRIASYNLHNYGTNNTAHDSDFKTIIGQLQPDIFVVVEMMTQNGVNRFLQNVLDQNYRAVTVSITGSTGNDCAAYYNETKINYLSTVQHPASPRDICEFRFASKSTGDTLIVFGVHLKANDYTSDNVINAQKRAATVQILRNVTNSYETRKNYLVCGDFNIFTSEEDAFKKLLDKSSPGYFYDPQNAFGNWTDNEFFASAHSYTPKNLTTRLDMILYSEALKQPGGVDYVMDSFKIYGNDGAHYRKAITSGTNYWLSFPALGSALENASDHLPVFAEFDFGIETAIVEQKSLPLSFELKQNYPNPFNPETVISYQLAVNSFVSLKIYDILSREVATLVNEFQLPGNYRPTFSTLYSALPSGVYFYQLKVGNFVQTKKMVLIK